MQLDWRGRIDDRNDLACGLLSGPGGLSEQNGELHAHLLEEDTRLQAVLAMPCPPWVHGFLAVPRRCPTGLPAGAMWFIWFWLVTWTTFSAWRLSPYWCFWLNLGARTV